MTPRERWVSTCYEGTELVFNTEKEAIDNAWMQEESNVFKVREVLPGDDTEVNRLKSDLAHSRRDFADAVSGCCDCPMFKSSSAEVKRLRTALEQIVSEGIDTSTEGGMKFVSDVLGLKGDT